MKIGITCYPTYGGSGVVATELGLALAKRGHEVHFISYAHALRLNIAPRAHQLSRGGRHAVSALRPYPPYDLALATQMAEVAPRTELDLLHVHYAIPHATSAYLAQQILRDRGRSRRVVTTLHGTDITLVGRDGFLPITKFAIEKSTGSPRCRECLQAETERSSDIAQADRGDPQLRRLGALFRRRPGAFATMVGARGEKLV